VSLADFEDRLSAGDVIAAMSVDEHEAAEAVLNKILEQSTEDVEIGAGRGR
jgi:hypothetical protein